MQLLSLVLPLILFTGFFFFFKVFPVFKSKFKFLDSFFPLLYLVRFFAVQFSPNHVPPETLFLFLCRVSHFSSINIFFLCPSRFQSISSLEYFSTSHEHTHPSFPRSPLRPTFFFSFLYGFPFPPTAAPISPLVQSRLPVVPTCKH